MESVSLAQARRLALTAQGFGDPPPAGAVTRRHVRRVLDRIHLFQIDSVNVLVRAHYMPLFARLGPYDRSVLDRMAYTDRELFEYWGHAASLIPVVHHPLVRWHMHFEPSSHGRPSLDRERPGYIDAVYDEVAARGPVSANDLDDPGERRGPWWGWADGKRALEWLHTTGRLAALRRPSFERVYDIAERVIPAPILALPTPTDHDARKGLARLASRALGVATLNDLCEYWFLNIPKTKPAVLELVEAGELVPVKVEGWKQPAYVASGAKAGRRGRTTVVAPFDSLVWNRDRVHRLFGFHYRIEIYVPAPKREFGYYVLPVVHGDQLVGRLDLKADRGNSVLAVRAAHHEDGRDPAAFVEPLAHNLRTMAGWLGLDDVRVDDRGDLAPALAHALTTNSRP
jgi:uncharacterized protein YcaQ